MHAVGASGSGKTTLLRTIAGLIQPTTGRIKIGDQDVTDLPIQARNIGFVFQNYALFPHMSVAENIAYPLKLQNWPAAERAGRVVEILDMIELPHVVGRAVGELSGGQQQRVAIGRALAYRPPLLLLDEPMGALDRRLRQQLGAQLRDIQQRTGITAVYVTHDQEEAFILSDKIAIMEKGSVLQFETPDALYFSPASRFSAEFLAVGAVASGAGGGRVLAETAFGPIAARDCRQTGGAGPLSLVVRPEALRLSAQALGPATAVEIEHVTFLGSRCTLKLRTEQGVSLLLECHKRDIPAPGVPVFILWDHADATLINQYASSDRLL